MDEEEGSRYTTQQWRRQRQHSAHSDNEELEKEGDRLPTEWNEAKVMGSVEDEENKPVRMMGRARMRRLGGGREGGEGIATTRLPQYIFLL